METSQPILSVVVPMYDEEDVLPIFFARMRPLLDGLGVSYEVLVVDDGSRDATAALLTEATRQWRQLRLVRLLRNSGHQAALSAGFRRARGEYLVTIDADLQDPPEVIADLLSAARDKDVDVVYGVRSDRSSDTWAKRTTARMYYRLMCRLVGKDIPFDAGDFRLVSRRVVDAVNALPEDGRVFRLVIPWLGFPSAEVSYVRAERAAGVTKYNVSKMLRLAFDSVTAFSAAPLRLATWLGLLGGLLSVVFVIGALVTKLTGQSIPGWTSTVLAVAVIGAIQLLCLGLLGEYVARLFQSSQKRPQFLVGYDSLEDPGHHSYAEVTEPRDPEHR
ncbi:glycosyl transferase family 2 [Kribbella flavida DSM 17836]|uniref:Glycosyl transferase family 2 n=1 Tax=Kribbella flavida (strain DSM 17836 / JCM 10339 / NBRC 14399) TaxID=479435 RepID=D2PVW8_KRIFD|nr:glycosyltransferase family 2 protein [Kribbella flavida]ADB29625.1 glycosyl transferase family 2 [Kribbella flavida DSM 17836]